MNNTVKYIFITFMLLASFYASAWDVDESNKTVAMVGVYGASQGFVVLNEGVHTNCNIQHLYFDVDTNKGQAIYSTLLSAYVSQKTVRIGYNFGTSTPGTCTLDLAALR